MPLLDPPFFASTIRPPVPDIIERMREEYLGAVITQPFGPTSNTVEPAYLGFPHFHQGVDLVLRQSGVSPEGMPVRAPASGVVAFAGYDPRPSSCGGFGNTVLIRAPNGYTYRLGHMSTLHSATVRGQNYDADQTSPLTRTGQMIYAGQVVGFQGSTGCSSGPHLHLEIRDPQNRPQSPTTETAGQAPLEVFGTLYHVLGFGGGYLPGQYYGEPAASHTMFQMPVPEPWPAQGHTGTIDPIYGSPPGPPSPGPTPDPGTQPPVGQPIGTSPYGFLPFGLGGGFDPSAIMPAVTLWLLGALLVIHGLFQLTGGSHGAPAQLVVNTVKDGAKVAAA